MVVSYSLQALNWAVKVSHKFFNELMLLSGRVLYHVISAPVRVSTKVLNFKASLD